VKRACSKCGTSYIEGDLFCRKCGVRLIPTPGVEDQAGSFELELLALLKMLKEFRVWVDQNKRRNVRFMRAYKEKMEKEIRSSIREFDERYRDSEKERSPLFHHITGAFSALNRPIPLMETKLRPSVGMGVFLERWMMTQAVESYLKECCQEADQHLDEIAKEFKPRSADGGQMQ
jgi:hypothetical protein